MAEKTFNVKIEGLDQLLAAFAREPAIAEPRLQSAIDGSQAILAKHRDGNVPQRSDRLITSFYFKSSRLMAEYFPTVKYAIWVHEGTKPHIIAAKNGLALAIPLTGGVYSGVSGGERTMKVRAGGRSRAGVAGKDFIFRRSVRHPGTKANPFMEKILHSAQPEIDQLFDRGLQLIVDDIARASQ